MNFRNLSTISVILLLHLIGISLIFCNNPDSENNQLSLRKSKPAYFLIDDGTPIRDVTKINKPRLYGFWGGLVLLDIYGINRLKETWYSQPISSFHFIGFKDDWKARKQADKIAHMMDGYLGAHLASKAYRWAGYSVKQSIWYGALTSWLWMLQIEFVDAFYEEWGFSVLDFTSNSVGVVYATLQQLYPDKLKGIRLKFSYHTSNAYRNNLYSETNTGRIDDYEGMTFWLAVNLYDIMPQNIKEKYPSWLSPVGISFGQSVNNIASYIYAGERQLYVGLDFDLTKLPTGDNKTLKLVKDLFNFVRMPMPTVRISPRTVWYGFYF